jgi:hypothetical protein
VDLQCCPKYILVDDVLVSRFMMTRARKRCYLKQEASSAVVPEGYYQDTKTLVAEVTAKKVGRKERGVSGLLA